MRPRNEAWNAHLGQKNLHAMLRGQQWVLLMTNSCAAETWFASLSVWPTGTLSRVVELRVSNVTVTSRS